MSKISPLSNTALEAELPGLNSAFINLQELGSDLDWQDAIADAWGIPYPEKSNKNSLESTRTKLFNILANYLKH